MNVNEQNNLNNIENDLRIELEKYKKNYLQSEEKFEKFKSNLFNLLNN